MIEISMADNKLYLIYSNILYNKQTLIESFYIIIIIINIFILYNYNNRTMI